MINHARRSQVDSKQARWELGKERVKRIMDAKNVCANASEREVDYCVAIK
ncbi:hypothetical protein HanXRQr2_Chr16g0751731 [Helianthus annuus]|uniref:Uncharacterized protein n=1 Tax=Helianthus annuus TaxID=4232 RepID=A0A9K3DTT0_HELAN|nr:hypothetical protein HanXRQr2_Chr16g0751731 [Helianthus annuus]KAJ0821466.1 hypothetical protein HanPSC8_Chr16g0720531 [Helianthus annuus]